MQEMVNSNERIAWSTRSDQFVAFDVKVTLEQVLSARYLSYAMSTITARSLPDARDAEPVHRRYCTRCGNCAKSRLGFKKCARIIGDVMGKYHPHGDQAIYAAMVRWPKILPYVIRWWMGRVTLVCRWR